MLKQKSYNVPRLENELFCILSHIMRFELNDQHIKNVSISYVKLSRDNRHLKVYLQTFNNPDFVLKRVYHLKKIIKYKLSRQLKNKFIPELSFFADLSYKLQEKIENLNKEIK